MVRFAEVRVSAEPGDGQVDAVVGRRQGPDAERLRGRRRPRPGQRRLETRQRLRQREQPVTRRHCRQQENQSRNQKSNQFICH